jgi:Fe-S-cluster containining protein
MTEPRGPNDREVLALEIETPDGTLRTALAVPPRPMRLPELAFGFLQVASKLTDVAVAGVERAGKTISCKKGCGACCRQVVPLSPPEAWLVADLVAGMPEPRRSEVRAAFAAASEVLRTSGVGAAVTARHENAEQMIAAALSYFKLELPCPFLRDDACSIHPYRPSICREYMVTSPAENCATLGRGPIERVPVSARLSEALVSLSAKLLGKEPEVVPMTLALDWAEANKADGQRTWDGRVLIEGLVAELGRRTSG